LASLKLPEALEEDSLKALALAEKHRRALVIGHYDADGISGTAVICAALKRLEVMFTARNIHVVTPDVLRALIEPARGVVFLTDLGSDMAPKLAPLRTPEREIVIVDHHPPGGRPPELVQINAHEYGMNGTYEACSGTMAYAMAITWDQANVGLFRQAIIGSIGDRQASRPQGLTKSLIAHAISRRAAHATEEVPLSAGPLDEAIVMSNDPYFRRLRTREDAAKLLKQAGIDPRADHSELPPAQKRTLTSLLVAELAGSGADHEAVANAVRSRFVFPDGERADELARLVDGCGRMGDTGTGLAVALGSKDARARAADFESKFRVRLLELIRAVDAATAAGDGSGVRERKALQWFECPDRNLVGTVAECVVSYIGRHDRPAFGFSRSDGEGYKGSARATRRQVDAGVDLTRACNDAGVAVGGSGGGHNIASGITVPEGKLEEFLDRADAIVSAQLRLS
jgi:RecJ-like exonuclease